MMRTARGLWRSLLWLDGYKKRLISETGCADTEQFLAGVVAQDRVGRRRAMEASPLIKAMFYKVGRSYTKKRGSVYFPC